MLTSPLVRTSLRKVIILRVVDGRVALSVEVTGPGVAEVDQERIFEQFVREADGSGEGTGLDLPVVRTIVEAHRGTVTFTSAPGFGTTFCHQPAVEPMANPS